jgi:hypothetical protein
MCARTLVERARIAQNVYQAVDEEPHIARLSLPLLAFFGTEEPWLGGEVELQTVRKQAVSSPHVHTALIDAADHVYWGRAAEAALLIAGWVDGLLEQRSADWPEPPVRREKVSAA